MIFTSINALHVKTNTNVVITRIVWYYCDSLNNYIVSVWNSTNENFKQRKILITSDYLLFNTCAYTNGQGRAYVTITANVYLINFSLYYCICYVINIMHYWFDKLETVVAVVLAVVVVVVAVIIMVVFGWCQQADE